MIHNKHFKKRNMITVALTSKLLTLVIFKVYFMKFRYKQGQDKIQFRKNRSQKNKSSFYLHMEMTKQFHIFINGDTLKNKDYNFYSLTTILFDNSEGRKYQKLVS